MAQVTQSDDRCKLPPTVRNAVEEVLDYLWDDELKHYACLPLDDLEAPHVFDSLLVLDGWLKAGTPGPQTL